MTTKIYYGRLRIIGNSVIKEHEELVDQVEWGAIGYPNIAVSENGDRLVSYFYASYPSIDQSIIELRANGVSVHDLSIGGRPIHRVGYPVFVDDVGYVVFYDVDEYVNVYKIEGSQATFVGRSVEAVDFNGLGAVGFNGSVYVSYVSHKSGNVKSVRLMVVKPDGSVIDNEVFEFDVDAPHSDDYWWATPFIHAGTRTLYILVFRALVNSSEVTIYLLKVDTGDNTASLKLTVNIPLEEDYRGINYNFNTAPVIYSRLQLFTYTIYRIVNNDWYYNVMLGGFTIPEDGEEGGAGGGGGDGGGGEGGEGVGGGAGVGIVGLTPLLLALLLLAVFSRVGRVLKDLAEHGKPKPSKRSVPKT